MVMRPPNIVFICTDQQRYDSLRCCGNQLAQTPHLDRLAADGVRFTRHNTPCPICSPSRATMLTGLYPRNHKLTVNGMALNPDLPTLMEMLAGNGYQTYGIGKHHLQPILAPGRFGMPESEAFWQRPEAHDWQGPYYGFQEVHFVIGEADKSAQSGHYASWLKKYHAEAINQLTVGAALDTPPDDLDEVWKCSLPSELHYNRWITRRAVNLINKQSNPFFMFVSFPDPHHPFSPPRPYCDRFDPDDMPLPVRSPGELDKMPSYYRELFRPGKEGVLKAYWESAEDAEQGFLLDTSDLNGSSIRRAIAHTFGMVTMIDDCVGDILHALDQNGLTENTLILFTSDHGELLGDHGLLHKGPPPYRQLREIPLLIKGPGLPLGKTIEALSSHIDLVPTILELAGITYEQKQFNGSSLVPLIKGQAHHIREFLFNEYHPRSHQKFYNQTIQNSDWRLTLYPLESGWGELFNLRDDPLECNNLYGENEYQAVIRSLGEKLNEEFPPQPQVSSERIAKW